MQTIIIVFLLLVWAVLGIKFVKQFKANTIDNMSKIKVLYCSFIGGPLVWIYITYCALQSIFKNK